MVLGFAISREPDAAVARSIAAARWGVHIDEAERPNAAVSPVVLAAACSAIIQPGPTGPSS
jgi:hypothetical protein